eukprot:TRINITY_DN2725_c0_g1_i1.p1 TRINITY_DN2725_c0_g1~~TRINITY_DN2725_c0_g1_i1.p1  ORF type:complete len:141 (-),score=39.77 TRINITY_DN2725_c0_g1_i1:78-467(-)
MAGDGPLGKIGAGGGCIICLVVTLGAIVVGIAAIVDGYHEIEEGYVGVYYKFGALQEGITGPGVHMKQAFVTTVRRVLIRPEETRMSSVETITRDEISIRFEGISVLSRTTQSKVIGLIKKYGQDFKRF